MWQATRTIMILGVMIARMYSSHLRVGISRQLRERAVVAQQELF